MDQSYKAGKFPEIVDARRIQEQVGKRGKGLLTRELMFGPGFSNRDRKQCQILGGD